MEKIPKGYHISRRGIISILTNPVYIGWMIVAGDIVSTHNHARLIPPDKEYLFWFAFDHLAEFTIKGEVNANRSLPPRRFFRRHTKDEAGLLKDRIEGLEGYVIYMHLCEGRTPCYRIVKKATKIYDKNASQIECDLIDGEFTKLLFTHLRQTNELDGFHQWITDVLQKRKTQTEIVMAQLEEIAVQQEAILDEKLAIRTHITEQVKAALAEDKAADVEALKVQFEQEVKQDIERLNIRAHKLDEREKELREKLPTGENEKEVKGARTFADFQTELEKLANVWEKKPLKEKKEFVNLLVKKAVLSHIATHWIQLTIHWTHPAWATQTLYMFRRRGHKVGWTDEEKEVLRTHYAASPREVLLQLLPHKSFAALHNQANRMSLQRPQELPRQKLSIDRLVTWSDYEFCQSMGVSPDTKEPICVSETSPNTETYPSPGR